MVDNNLKDSFQKLVERAYKLENINDELIKEGVNICYEMATKSGFKLYKSEKVEEYLVDLVYEMVRLEVLIEFGFEICTSVGRNKIIVGCRGVGKSTLLKVGAKVIEALCKHIAVYEWNFEERPALNEDARPTKHFGITSPDSQELKAEIILRKKTVFLFMDEFQKLDVDLQDPNASVSKMILSDMMLFAKNPFSVVFVASSVNSITRIVFRHTGPVKSLLPNMNDQVFTVLRVPELRNENEIKEFIGGRKPNIDMNELFYYKGGIGREMLDFHKP
eukprot:NODE_4_length_55019_cov_0.425091.p22 type:complete len:276 gc:universal NODE_4_length_55019_cov_0.425091:27908-28735(+)